MFSEILVEFAALVGFAALVSVIVNILKVAGVVKDGTADKWVAGFNLAGVLGFAIFTPWRRHGLNAPFGNNGLVR